MSASIISLEMQVGQLATELKNQQNGKFPSDTEHNRREQCKAICWEVKEKSSHPIQGKFGVRKLKIKLKLEKKTTQSSPKD